MSLPLQAFRAGLLSLLWAPQVHAETPVLVEAPTEAGPEVSSAAEAKPFAAALTVRYEGSCIEAVELAARVQRWLRKDVVDRRLSIVVEGGDTPKGRALSFVVFSNGEMVAVRRFGTLTAECDAVLDVLSFSIAVSVDASVSERAVSADGQLDPAAGASTKPVIAASPVKAHADALPPPKKESRPLLVPASLPSPALRQTEWSLTGAAFGALSLLPREAFGGEVMARVRLPLGVAPGLGFIATSPRDFGVGQGGASSALFAGRADLAKFWRVGPFDTGLAAGVLVGSAESAGTDLVRAKSVSLLWSALEARLLAELPLSANISVHSALGGSMAWIRPALDVVASDGKVVSSRTFPGLSANASVGLTAVLR